MHAFAIIINFYFHFFLNFCDLFSASWLVVILVIVAVNILAVADNYVSFSAI